MGRASVQPHSGIMASQGAVKELEVGAILLLDAGAIAELEVGAILLLDAGAIVELDVCVIAELEAGAALLLVAGFSLPPVMKSSTWVTPVLL